MSEGNKLDQLSCLSKLINISGRQRMLSQRIAFAIFSKLNNFDSDLNADIEIFEKSHELLKTGNNDLPAPVKGSTLYEYFFGVHNADKTILHYISLAKSIHSGDVSQLNFFFDISYREIVPLLNKAVVIYESMAKEISDSINTLIEDTLEDIKEVSLHTKFISFNANLIAERSGEFGREIYVVGNEIQNLTKQTDQLILNCLKTLKGND